MKYLQNIRQTFFSKAQLFLSRGGLLGNKGRLLGNKAGLLEERIKILNDTRDTWHSWHVFEDFDSIFVDFERMRAIQLHTESGTFSHRHHKKRVEALFLHLFWEYLKVELEEGENGDIQPLKDLMKYSTYW